MNTYKVTPVSVYGAKAPSFFVEASDSKITRKDLQVATRLADFPNYWSFEIENVEPCK